MDENTPPPPSYDSTSAISDLLLFDFESHSASAANAYFLGTIEEFRQMTDTSTADRSDSRGSLSGALGALPIGTQVRGTTVQQSGYCTNDSFTSEFYDGLQLRGLERTHPEMFRVDQLSTHSDEYRSMRPLSPASYIDRVHGSADVLPRPNSRDAYTDDAQSFTTGPYRHHPPIGNPAQLQLTKENKLRWSSPVDAMQSSGASSASNRSQSPANAVEQNTATDRAMTAPGAESLANSLASAKLRTDGIIRVQSFGNDMRRSDSPGIVSFMSESAKDEALALDFARMGMSTEQTNDLQTADNTSAASEHWTASSSPAQFQSGVVENTASVTEMFDANYLAIIAPLPVGIRAQVTVVEKTPLRSLRDNANYSKKIKACRENIHRYLEHLTDLETWLDTRLRASEEYVRRILKAESNLRVSDASVPGCGAVRVNSGSGSRLSLSSSNTSHKLAMSVSDAEMQRDYVAVVLAKRYADLARYLQSARHDNRPGVTCAADSRYSLLAPLRNASINAALSVLRVCDKNSWNKDEGMKLLTSERKTSGTKDVAVKALKTTTAAGASNLSVVTSVGTSSVRSNPPTLTNETKTQEYKAKFSEKLPGTSAVKSTNAADATTGVHACSPLAGDVNTNSALTDGVNTASTVSANTQQNRLITSAVQVTTAASMATSATPAQSSAQSGTATMRNVEGNVKTPMKATTATTTIQRSAKDSSPSDSVTPQHTATASARKFPLSATSGVTSAPPKSQPNSDTISTAASIQTTNSAVKATKPAPTDTALVHDAVRSKLTSNTAPGAATRDRPPNIAPPTAIVGATHGCTADQVREYMSVLFTFTSVGLRPGVGAVVHQGINVRSNGIDFAVMRASFCKLAPVRRHSSKNNAARKQSAQQSRDIFDDFIKENLPSIRRFSLSSPSRRLHIDSDQHKPPSTLIAAILLCTHESLSDRLPYESYVAHQYLKGLAVIENKERGPMHEAFTAVFTKYENVDKLFTEFQTTCIAHLHSVLRDINEQFRGQCTCPYAYHMLLTNVDVRPP